MKKILLIRFSSIGDIVLTTPVIRALKNQLGCELHVITKEPFRIVLSGNPYINKLYSWEKNIKEVFNELKSENYDFIVDLQKNRKSVKLRQQLKRPSSSFPKLNLQKWLLVNFKLNTLPDIHIVDRYFKAVSVLGIKKDKQGLDYFIPPEDEISPTKIDPLLMKGYIGFVIGGKHNTKVLPNDKVVEIIDQLHLPIVLFGGEEDHKRGDELENIVSSGKIINTCGQFSLNQSASLVKQASLMITNDTGLMHIAAAFKKPIISIWGNTVPGFGMYPYFPEKVSTSFFSEVEGLKCRPCSKLGFKKCPKKHFRCMLDQDVTGIVEKAKELAIF